MKVAIAQLNFHIGDFDGNLKKMTKAVESAKKEKADLICFSELATCGYPARDFLDFDDFINLCEQSIEKLTALTTDIAIVVGSPTRNPVPEGKDLYNSAYFLANKKVKYIQHKALLPTYDVFDEYRYFEPANTFSLVEYKDKKIALTVCEDIWNIGNKNPLYTVCPLDEVIDQKPDFVINVSASPFTYQKGQDRIEIVKENLKRYGVPMFYVNHVGAQTELIFDGGSLVGSPNGNIHAELPYFEESVQYFDLGDVIKNEKEEVQEKEKIALIHDALLLGIKDYFGKLGFKKTIFGLSGGIDSAVTAVLAARALGKDNVRCILMPSQYSSDHSVNDARQLAVNLGIQYDIMPIESIYKSYEEILSPHFFGTQANVTEENIQARIRGMLLMAISNKFGNIVLNTSNKSEMAVGYGTLYGDMCGGISVLGDVYKTDVFALAKYINKDGIVIPENSITKPPSAELRPDQKDSDSLPPYDILDDILYEYIENTKGPEEIIEMGYNAKLVRRILRMVNINEFKRYQTAPVLRVSRKAFGMGRRLPIVGKYLS